MNIQPHKTELCEVGATLCTHSKGIRAKNAMPLPSLIVLRRTENHFGDFPACADRWTDDLQLGAYDSAMDECTVARQVAQFGKAEEANFRQWEDSAP